MKKRDLYLKRLIAYRDTDWIKVISGIRRCGKSTLLDLFAAHLRESGVPDSAMIRMNFESLEFDSLLNYDDLYKHIHARIAPEGKTYILLDEVQQVDQWERAVNSLRLLPQTDIYITGSNAYLLASEITTLLSGRFVEIRMLPLSFSEYLDFQDIPSTGELQAPFQRYLQYGGFPGITQLSGTPEAIPSVLEGIYSTVIMKDVAARNAVRDISLLDGVVRFAAANIGSLLSTRSICAYLTSAGRKTSGETIDAYLRMLEDAYVLYRARRFDIKGKQFLKTQEKFYFVDTGLRNMLVGSRGGDIGHVLENIVYFELLRRGYTVSIGKVGTFEVDFVASRSDTRMYVQVCASILDEVTRERELRPLRAIPDNYEKLVVTLDPPYVTDYEGIRHVQALAFLTEA